MSLVIRSTFRFLLFLSVVTGCQSRDQQGKARQEAEQKQELAPVDAMPANASDPSQVPAGQYEGQSKRGVNEAQVDAYLRQQLGDDYQQQPIYAQQLRLRNTCDGQLKRKLSRHIDDPKEALELRYKRYQSLLDAPPRWVATSYELHGSAAHAQACEQLLRWVDSRGRAPFALHSKVDIHSQRLFFEAETQGELLEALQNSQPGDTIGPLELGYRSCMVLRIEAKTQGARPLKAVQQVLQRNGTERCRERLCGSFFAPKTNPSVGLGDLFWFGKTTDSP